MKRTCHLSTLTFILGLALLAGCSQNAYPNPSPEGTSGVPPTLVEATPIQLPYIEKSVEGQYCRRQVISLPISETQGWSDDEIAEKIMSLYLDYFNNPQAPDYCRVDGYRIDAVFRDEKLEATSLAPNNGFLRGIQFSIKLVQLPNYWMGYIGELDEQNWYHLSDVLVVFKSESKGVYKAHLRHKTGG
ncbi:MAG: hypothetical protein ACOY0R_18950 [Chloroflexota bacterium]